MGLPGGFRKQTVICQGIYWICVTFVDHIDKIWNRVTGASSRSVVVTPLGVDIK